MSIFYETPEDNDIINNETDIIDIHEENSDDDDEDKEHKKRVPISLDVLHQKRIEERRKQEERDKLKERHATSGSNALKMRPCYEFVSIFY